MPNNNQKKFPNEPMQAHLVEQEIDLVKSYLHQRIIERNLGHLYTRPQPVAVSTLNVFNTQNPNNLGYWSDAACQYVGTKKMEQEVVQMLIDLYGGDFNNYGGYITSGATEGNIYFAWAGRVALERFVGREKICMLKTSLTHYSVTKAANVTGVPYYDVALSPQSWSVSISALSAVIKKLYSEGFRGFIIPLTLGYTLTGTSDDITKVSNLISILKQKLPDTFYFVWIDAALSGLVLPFCDDGFSPLMNDCIEGFVVDFHKFWGVPYGAGAVIHKKNISRKIEQNISYIRQTDMSLLGSRPGAVAAAVWTLINTFGHTHFQSLVLEQLRNKEFFIQIIKNVVPDADVVTEKNSVTCAVCFRTLPNAKLPSWLEKKYWLFGKKDTYRFDDNSTFETIYYKFHFLPHIKEEVLEDFNRDIRLVFG